MRRWSALTLGLGIGLAALACGGAAADPPAPDEPVAEAPDTPRRDRAGRNEPGRRKRGGRRGARAEDPSVQRACDVRAYVGVKRGPTQLHDAPGGRVLATWPVQEPLDGGLSAGPILEIVGSTEDGAWLKIGAIESLADPVRGPTVGWVRREGLEVDLAMSEVSPDLAPPTPIPLRDRPSPQGAVVRTYLQEPHRAEVLGCEGEWMKVRVTLLSGDGPPREGWLAPGDHCGNPVTTCG